MAKARQIVNEYLPGLQLTQHDLEYLYGITKDEDLNPEAYARAKDMAIDLTMTTFARTYKFEDQRLIADIMAPPKMVRSRKGDWKTRGKEALNVFVSDIGAQSGEAHEIGYAVGETPYETNKYQLRTFVSDEEILERGAIDPAQEATILLKHGLALRREVRVRNLADATSNGVTIGTDWDTSAAVHTDVAAAKNAFEAQLGQSATGICIGTHVANEILTNPNIDMGVFTATSVQKGPDAIRYMDVGQFPSSPWGLKPIIPNGMYNTAADPLETAVLTRVWGDDAFLVRLDPSNRTSTWAITVVLLMPTVIRWREPGRDGFQYKMVTKYAVIEVTEEAIYKLTDVT